jgi:hypothetical protein
MNSDSVSDCLAACLSRRTQWVWGRRSELVRSTLPTPLKLQGFRELQGLTAVACLSLVILISGHDNYTFWLSSLISRSEAVLPGLGSEFVTSDCPQSQISQSRVTVLWHPCTVPKFITLLELLSCMRYILIKWRPVISLHLFCSHDGSKLTQFTNKHL